MPYTAPSTMNAATQIIATWFINHADRFDGSDPDDLWNADAVRDHAYDMAYECVADADSDDADIAAEAAADAASDWCKTIVLHSLWRHAMDENNIDWVAIAAAHNDYHAQQA
jgi:hypothetical protein